MKVARVCLVITVLSALSAEARDGASRAKSQRKQAGKTVSLRLQLPPSGGEAALRLLPAPEQQTDKDAYPLYERAKALAARQVDRRTLSEWSGMKPEQLPLDEVRQALERSAQAQQLLDQAVRCSQCNWPTWQPGMPPANLTDYRTLAWLLAVKARYEMAQGNHENGVSTMCTGFGLARHLAEGPTLVHGMVGTAVAALMCKQIETFAEQPGAPSLYVAIDSLPKPFISLEEQIQFEVDNLDKQPGVNALNRWVLKRQLGPAHDRVRLIVKRSNRQIAALQCIEALRLYAETHKGALPQSLDNVTEGTLPNDPVTEKPFVYRCSDAIATLASPATEDPDAKGALQYEITIAQTK